MAWYPKAVRKNIPPGPNDPPIKARVVILHVADSEATSLFPYFNGPSGGVESHFYIRYDGTIEQYRDTAYQADANVMANDFAISIETQGLASGKWTPEQLAAIKALLTWGHDVHGIPLQVPRTWDGSGVGYHVLFEDQWDQRGASCPGPNRINQFNTVLVPWMAASGSEDDMPDPKDLWNYQIEAPDGSRSYTAADWLRYANLKAENANATAGAALAVVKALAAKLPEGLTADEVAAAAKAGAKAALAEEIDSATVTLNTKES